MNKFKINLLNFIGVFIIQACGSFHSHTLTLTLYTIDNVVNDHSWNIYYCQLITHFFWHIKILFVAVALIMSL